MQYYSSIHGKQSAMLYLCHKTFDQRIQKFSSYQFSCTPILKLTSQTRTEAIGSDKEIETDPNKLVKLYHVFVGFHLTRTAKQTLSQ